MFLTWTARYQPNHIICVMPRASFRSVLLRMVGTPNGCALRVPPPVRRLLQVLPERALWKLFLNGQARRPQYLKPGDRITARIRSRDCAVDLGEQATEIVGP